MAVKIWNYRSWIAGFCTALFFTLYPTVAEKEAESKKWHREKEVLVNRMGELTEGMRKSYRFIGEAAGTALKVLEGIENPPVRICGYVKDPEKQEILPMPENSYRKGSGKKYKVILEVDRLSVKDKGRTVLKIRQGGRFDLIGARTGAGIFYGEPGKDINVGLTLDELYKMLDGGETPLQVMGLNYIGKDKKNALITGSYRGVMKVGNFLHIGDRQLSK